MWHLGAGADVEFAAHGFIALGAQQLLAQTRDEQIGLLHAQLGLGGDVLVLGMFLTWYLVWPLPVLVLLLL
jgi:hypothetical protein